MYLCFAVIADSTNFHTDLFPAYDKSLAAGPRLRARIFERTNVNIYTSFSGFAHSFSNPAGSKSKSEKLGVKSYVEHTLFPRLNWSVSSMYWQEHQLLETHATRAELYETSFRLNTFAQLSLLLLLLHHR